MALYLGGNKVKATLNGVTYCFNAFFKSPIMNSIRLLSRDGYTLQDSNGLDLITKKEGE